MASSRSTRRRIDPYGNFRFRVVFGTDVVAGVSKVSGLKHTTELVDHRDGGDLSTKRTVARASPPSSRSPSSGGITHDPAFEEWAHARLLDRSGRGGVS